MRIVLIICFLIPTLGFSKEIRGFVAQIEKKYYIKIQMPGTSEQVRILEANPKLWIWKKFAEIFVTVEGDFIPCEGENRCFKPSTEPKMSVYDPLGK